MENQIKKGVDFYLYYWVVLFFIFFIFINHVVKPVSVADLNAGFMISVVSFLFGFFITISFTMVLNRVVALKDSLAVETGRLVSLFLLSKHLGEKFHEKITDFIDKYTIATLRYYTTYEVGREFIYGINNELNLMELKNINQKTIADSFLYILGEIEPVREKIESLTKGRLLKAIKLTNYTLAFLLISILFLNRGDIFADTLFIVLSTTVVFILLILEDYENLKIGDYIVNISNSEQLFDLIGRKRYYPRSLLRKVRLERGKTYRIGFYNSKNHSEETVTLEYSHEFDLRVQRLFSRFLKKQKNI